MDFYLKEDGDIAVSPSGDIALTESSWRNFAQQAYVRIMTEMGDFLLYPKLGAELSALYGMPQKPETGEYGKKLIVAALGREGLFVGQNISVKAVPTGPQTIRFDIYIGVTNAETQILSIEQNLGDA